MKRFFSEVSFDQVNGGYRVLLDGRAVKTPSKRDLLIPSLGIVQAVVEEWEAQVQEINPQTMPLTQILNTKQDRVEKEREVMTQYIMRYFNSDLLCYRADFPPALVELQNVIWQPWLEWFEKTYGSKLLVTNGLQVLKQDSDIYNKVGSVINALDDFKFTIFQLVVSLSGSIVMGLAFIKGAVNPQEMLKVIYLEEQFKDGIYNAEKYGQDPIQEKQQNSVMRDLQACYNLLQKY